MNLVETLVKKGLVEPPKWLPSAVQFLTVMGSEAYGCAKDTSDKDIYGFAIPPKHQIFGSREEIVGFDSPMDRFQEYQKHKVLDGTQEYDLTIFSISKYFKLLSDGNPNCLDSIFTPLDCQIFKTKAGQLLLDNKKLFLSKQIIPRFLGYSISQLKKMENKQPQEGSNRWVDIQTHGFSTKYGTHLVRLLLECEQLLIDGDLDMRKNSDILLEIRSGKWTKEQILTWSQEKEVELKEIGKKSMLPEKPCLVSIKNLLLNCLHENSRTTTTPKTQSDLPLPNSKISIF